MPLSILCYGNLKQSSETLCVSIGSNLNARGNPKEKPFLETFQWKSDHICKRQGKVVVFLPTSHLLKRTIKAAGPIDNTPD
jgi:hypothetical protein